MTTNAKKETMTDKLAAKLSAAWSIDFQKGEKPWNRPWYSIGDGAKSYSTGHYYSLLNQVLLAFSGTGYRDGMEYATFNQIKQAGGKVKKGEHAAQVLLVTRWQPKDPETGKPATRKDPETGEEKPLILRHRRGFNLFSLDQCEGITPKWEGKKDPRKLDIATRNPEIDSMIMDYCKREGIEFKEGGWKAYFRKANIEIRVPKFEDFTSPAEYYSTFFHEASHYADRIYLDSGKYVCLDWYRAACECVAECSCALIMRYLGIETAATNENSTAYINEWGDMVKEKPEIVLDIIARAERAARAVLGLTENPEPEPEQTEAEPQPVTMEETQPETQPAPVVEVVTPAPVKSNPRPLRAILLDDDDDDADLVTCQLVGLNL